jgi:hypothetical protein
MSLPQLQVVMGMHQLKQKEVELGLRREELAATKMNEKKRRQIDRERNVLERRQHKAFRSANKLSDDDDDDDEEDLSEDEDEIQAREQAARVEAQRREDEARRLVDEENTKRKAGNVLPPLQFDVTWKEFKAVNQARLDRNAKLLTVADWIDMYEGDRIVYDISIEHRRWLREENERRVGSCDVAVEFVGAWKDFRQVNRERKLQKLPLFTFKVWILEHGGNKFCYDYNLAPADESEGDEPKNA